MDGDDGCDDRYLENNLLRLNLTMASSTCQENVSQSKFKSLKNDQPWLEETPGNRKERNGE
jgi:hypothetical protein